MHIPFEIKTSREELEKYYDIPVGTADWVKVHDSDKGMTYHVFLGNEKRLLVAIYKHKDLYFADVAFFEGTAGENKTFRLPYKMDS